MKPRLPKLPDPPLIPEWALWIAFGWGAIVTIFLAVTDSHPLWVAVMGFITGINLMNAWLRPQMDRIERQGKELMEQASALLDKMEGIEGRDRSRLN